MHIPEIPEDALSSRAGYRAAELHWYLVSAASRLNERTIKPVKPGTLTRYERTEFGDEVGRDEINWWVFKREQDLGVLLERSDAALAHAQAIKDAAQKLRTLRPSSYENLVAALMQFLDAHEDHVGALRDYASWLFARDPLAPSILFSYRVWGSTRRSDRWGVQLDADHPAAEAAETIRRLTQIVIGLRGRFDLRWRRAMLEVQSDMFEAENFGEISTEDVLVLTVRWTLDACAEYWEQLRDSLREIVVDIDTCRQQRDLLHSASFWRRFVAKAIDAAVPESQLWDFKQTLSFWEANGQDKERTRIDVAENIAAFANADGGVLIVGVTDDRQIVGVGDARQAETRMKLVSDLISDRLEYPRALVEQRQVRLRSADGDYKICVLLIVAQACEGVGVRGLNNTYTYPVRRATGLERVSRLKLFRTHLNADNFEYLQRLLAFVDES